MYKAFLLTYSINAAKYLVYVIIIAYTRIFNIQFYYFSFTIPLVIENLVLRFDDIYTKKFKKTYIKFLGNVIETNNYEDYANSNGT